MAKKDKITYNSELDYLDIQVDRKQCSDVFISKPHQNVSLTFNKDTGGLIQVMISDFFEVIKHSDGAVNWDMDSDSLSVSLTKDHTVDALCDLVYFDDKTQTMVTLNRNEYGNLTGMEIINVHKLIKKFST
tara:strand:- start:190 stop:582 length:393 start_codon:yes stop_codon:yes gene_type:complete